MSDLIKREDAIDVVMKHKIPFSIQQEVAREIDALPTADAEWIPREHFDVLKKNYDMLAGLLEEAKARAIGAWVPVSERFPEEKEIVLTYDSIGHIDFGQYDRGLWYWLAEACADYWMRNDGVIAWQPLPKPYKGE